MYLRKNNISLRQRDFEACVRQHMDVLKQKIAALGKRLRRYNQTTKRHTQNRLFRTNQHKFYASLGEEAIVINDVPDKTSMVEFWSGIWSTPAQYNQSAEWLNEEEKACEVIRKMQEVCIGVADVRKAVNRMSNWKAPGPDKLQNFWIKRFSSAHEVLAAQFQRLVTGEDDIPDFLATGITYMKPKTTDTAQPKNYRPITCLPTLYKLMTSIITAKITEHLTAQNVLTVEQNGCRSGSRGTKEQLLVDMVVTSQAYHEQRNISIGWIDYKKAFDSVPHAWLVRCLKLYKVDSTLTDFLQVCMSRWSTVLSVSGTSESFLTRPVRIRRGIFQGDSLSPLWFCLALNPLSRQLRSSPYGYDLKTLAKHKVSHLFYMDDLKLYAPNRDKLHSLVEITKRFSADICMEFGLDKCAVLDCKAGKVVHTEDLQLMDGTSVPHLDIDATYKYLGMHQLMSINTMLIKQSVQEAYVKRVTKVMRSELNAGSKFCALNSWAVPVLMYSFGVVSWSQTELLALNRLTRTILTKYRGHHPNASVNRLYLPRSRGGRGLLDLQNLCNNEVNGLYEYFQSKQYEPLHRAVMLADSSYTPSRLGAAHGPGKPVMTEAQRRDDWRGKALHGRYPKQLEGGDVDYEASVAWQKSGELFMETEGFLLAIQDQVVRTRNYRKFIIKEDGVIDKCRMCGQAGENIQHITSGCPALANVEYLQRHNQLAKIIHAQLAANHKLLDSVPAYYKYQPEPVLENNECRLYWDRSIVTDKTIPSNRPDVVFVLKKERIGFLVDVTVPRDDNLKLAEREKIRKYFELANEVKDMWKLHRVEIVPVVISSTGLVANNFKDHLLKLGLHANLMPKLQKAAILGTCSIVRKVLNL
jgi:hypothetical protein